jgi:hypothetical protein
MFCVCKFGLFALLVDCYVQQANHITKTSDAGRLLMTDRAMKKLKQSLSTQKLGERGLMYSEDIDAQQTSFVQQSDSEEEWSDGYESSLEFASSVAIASKTKTIDISEVPVEDLAIDLTEDPVVDLTGPTVDLTGEETVCLHYRFKPQQIYFGSTEILLHAYIDALVWYHFM